MTLLIGSLRSLNGLLTAAIAITAFSIVMYTLSFGLKERVTRAFTVVLFCVLFVFGCEATGLITRSLEGLNFWARLQWIGILFLPAAYLQLSDALLATTGRPSRYRRWWTIRIFYGISLLFALLLPSNILVGPLLTIPPAPHLERTWLTWVFAVYYALGMSMAWYNFLRAFRRTITSATRRRIGYFTVGALSPALGSYPYLLFGPGLASRMPALFWTAVTVSNLLTLVFLVVMAYAAAFFGVSWPDRVIKRRLLKWLLRGPATASLVLALTSIVRQAGGKFGLDTQPLIPILMVGGILVCEHIITLSAPVWEKRLFLMRKDLEEMDLLQTLEERLLTLGDLQEFLESVLAAICDRLQTRRAFIALMGGPGSELLITIGGETPFGEEHIPAHLVEAAEQNAGKTDLFTWGDYWLTPMFDEDEPSRLLGMIGVQRKLEALDEEQREALSALAERARLAVVDRQRQQQAFSSLQELTPQMDMIQRLRAVSRYDGSKILSANEADLQASQLSPWIKDALTHYWGGPKLTQNPLLHLQVVQQTALSSQETPANALRVVLRKAIEDIRPAGERRFTAEWLLYNILEMKFLEGHKVREIALRLAMSEADLYRKQRVAIESVANAILQMEQQAQQNGSAVKITHP